MNNIDFLNNDDINQFVEWLCKKIATIPLHISIIPSRFVPNGLTLDTEGIEDVCANYQWNASWTNNNGQIIKSSDWSSTQDSLTKLSIWLNESLKSNNDDELFRAACATLKWGGVPRARLFLDGLRKQKKLVEYLSRIQKAMALCSAELNQLNPDLIHRFDAGLTKIHAFLSHDGLPIYDSRVAATITAFVYLYKLETNGNISYLYFPSSEARGNQIRNLRNLNGGNVFPNLYSNAPVSYANWAKAQVKLGWILSEVLDRTPELFANESSLEKKIHALEASFFMIGYNLKCIEELFINEVKIAPIEPYNMPVNNNLNLWGQPFSGIKVPTSHNFKTVICFYNDFRRDNPNDTEINNFKDWLVNNHGLKPTTAASYCYPLRYNQMSILDLSDAEVGLLANQPTGNFSRTFLQQWRRCAIDESLPNCIADIYIAGYVANHNWVGAEATNRIIQFGFAGTTNSANAILFVGRSMGKYFGFLNQQNQPTNYFNEYFN